MFTLFFFFFQLLLSVPIYQNENENSFYKFVNYLFNYWFNWAVFFVMKALQNKRIRYRACIWYFINSTLLLKPLRPRYSNYEKKSPYSHKFSIGFKSWIFPGHKCFPKAVRTCFPKILIIDFSVCAWLHLIESQYFSIEKYITPINSKYTGNIFYRK